MSIQTPQLAHLSENVRLFWEEKQQELGETLLKFSYTIFVEPVRFPALEKSGIFYLMDRASGVTPVRFCVLYEN